MTRSMTSTRFALTVSEEQAWDIVRAKAPGLRPGAATLRYHPFSGFVHRSLRPVPGRRHEDRVHTLVDRFTGSAFITAPWPQLEEAGPGTAESQVSDPSWNTISFEEARRRSTRIVRTATIRRAPLASRMAIEEVEHHELLWKPNWLLDATLGPRELRILVDALGGGYYVVGS